MTMKSEKLLFSKNCSSSCFTYFAMDFFSQGGWKNFWLLFAQTWKATRQKANVGEH